MSLADMGTATRGGGVAAIDHSSGGGVGGSGAGGGAGGLPGAGRMTHSLSTPSGVDGTPSTPRHRGGKKLTVRIQMLDDTVTMFQVQYSCAARFSVHYMETKSENQTIRPIGWLAGWLMRTDNPSTKYPILDDVAELTSQDAMLITTN
uniref:Uncharacterized protein n=1 Tax=Glossina palpalis gambiensis TaxID=67801 RepID=A0A1B0BP69_9MUSC